MFLVLICLGLTLNATGTPLEQGLVALRQERVQAAAYYFRQALKGNPENGIARLRLAEANVDLGELQKAEQAYRESLEDESTKTVAQVGLAALVRDMGRTEESLDLLQKALESDPDIYITYFADNNEEVRVNIRRRGYSYGSDWYWAGGLRLMAGDSGTEIRTFDQGSLIVDIYGSSSSELTRPDHWPPP